jgi:hypothetical protein
MKRDNTNAFHTRFYSVTSLHVRDDVQDVQFVGQAVQHREATQWMVTWAMLSSGLTVSSHEEVCRQNERVSAFMHAHGLVRMGWLRVVSHGGPLSMSDIHKQKVRDRKRCPLHGRLLQNALYIFWPCALKMPRNLTGGMVPSFQLAPECKERPSWTKMTAS